MGVTQTVMGVMAIALIVATISVVANRWMRRSNLQKLYFKKHNKIFNYKVNQRLEKINKQVSILYSYFKSRELFLQDETIEFYKNTNILEEYEDLLKIKIRLKIYKYIENKTLKKFLNTIEELDNNTIIYNLDNVKEQFDVFKQKVVDMIIDDEKGFNNDN